MENYSENLAFPTRAILPLNLTRWAFHPVDDLSFEVRFDCSESQSTKLATDAYPMADRLFMFSFLWNLCTLADYDCHWFKFSSGAQTPDLIHADFMDKSHLQAFAQDFAYKFR